MSKLAKKVAFVTGGSPTWCVFGSSSVAAGLYGAEEAARRRSGSQKEGSEAGIR